MTLRLWPQSLFGRLVGVLGVGLVLAQVLSAWINWAERDRVLLEAAGMQPVQRVADVVHLLDPLSRAERERIVGILNAPPLVVTLNHAPLSENPREEAAPHVRMFSVMLRAALGENRAVRVAVRTGPSEVRPGAGQWPGRHAMMLAQRGNDADRYAMTPGNVRLVTQVRLEDGQWATFESQLPREATRLPLRLLLTLTVLLVVVLGLSFIGVRWLSRPLQTLADAAEGLGKNIHSPPLAEDGPTEVQRAARAFNTMQSRLVRYIDDRTRVLAAMSHDLKTPLTRMRLRAELLDDDDTRKRFENDLGEMQCMVTDALSALRDFDGPAQSVPVDMNALLESLQRDNEEMGRQVEITGRVAAPLMGDPQRLKRCVGNLVENAVLYGGRAHVGVEDGVKALTVKIHDEGPGIPEPMLERVFDPFFRLESSRNRDTGGSGLGLSIARNIARAAGGDVSLRNLPTGGLEASLVLPR